MPVTKECARCHSPFQVAPAHAAKHRFCSGECRIAARMERTQTCSACGKRFLVPPSRLSRIKTCSPECRARVKQDRTPDRFWRFVDKAGECWLWNGLRLESGYGFFSLNASQEKRNAGILAHRMSWKLAHGPIPDRAHVLHRCDNPPCVRPDHLFLGDQAINNADRDSKDRVRHGSAHRNAKLSEIDVQRIRTLYATGAISHRQLARGFGISHQTIGDVLSGRIWKRV
jgi:hypothetical protein